MPEGWDKFDDEFRIVVKGRDLTPLILDRIQREQSARVRAAEVQLATAAKSRAERKFIQDGDGGGYADWMMSPTLFHAFGRKWGYAAMHDKDFVRDCLKHGTAVKVKNTNARPTFGFRAALTGGSGLASAASQHSRFKKTYQFS